MNAGTLSIGGVKIAVRVEPGLQKKLFDNAVRWGKATLKESRILPDMGNVYKKVEWHGVSVPIYEDERKLRNGTSKRYRVPYMEAGVPRQKAFTGRPLEAEAFATEVAKNIKMGMALASGTCAGSEKLVAAAVEASKIAADHEMSLIDMAKEWERIRKAAGATPVEEVIRVGMEKIKGDHPEVPATVAEVQAKFTAHIRAQLLDPNNPMTRSRHDRYKCEVARFAAKFGPMPIEGITATDIAGYYAGAPSFATAQAYRGALRKFFEFARDSAKALASTAEKTQADVAKIPSTLPQAPASGTIPILEPEEFRAVMDHAWAHQEFHPIIPILILRFGAGVHLTEILRSTWEQFIEEQRGLHLDTAQTGRNHHGRVAVLSPDHWTHVSFFLDQKREDGLLGTPIFPGISKFEENDERSLTSKYRGKFKRLLRAVSLEPECNVERHTFATMASLLTCNMTYVSKKMGTSRARVNRFYINKHSCADADPYFRVARPGCTNSTLAAYEWLPPNTIRSKADIIADFEEQQVRAKNTYCGR